MESRLKESLRKHADDFYDFLIANNIADDEFEFGAWDHFWLSALISHWIKKFTEIPSSGVNNEFITCCLEDGEKLQRVTFAEISDRFRALSKDESDDEFFDETMRMLKEFYRIMWV